ncbi:MAG: hypothetical protein OXG95_00260 [Chloroflexi bacterium]|nr:hypothetical protein [Chloroflexota bacterium]
MANAKFYLYALALWVVLAGVGLLIHVDVFDRIASLAGLLVAIGLGAFLHHRFGRSPR